MNFYTKPKINIKSKKLLNQLGFARTAIVQSSEHGDSLRYKLARPPKSRISLRPRDAVNNFLLIGEGARYLEGSHLHREFMKSEVQSRMYICRWLSCRLVTVTLFSLVWLSRPQEQVGESSER